MKQKGVIVRHLWGAEGYFNTCVLLARHEKRPSSFHKKQLFDVYHIQEHLDYIVNLLFLLNSESICTDMF